MSATRTRRNARTSTHLTRRGRLVVVVVLAALLYAAFSVGRAGTSASTAAEASSGGSVTPASAELTVRPGESLWAVAERTAPDTDPREVVRRIRDLNELTGATLHAGQRLLVPLAA